MDWDDVNGPLTYSGDGTMVPDMDSEIEVGEHAKLRSGEFEVKVEITEVWDDCIEGEIIHLGPEPQLEANGLCLGDIVEFNEENIVTLYRN